MEILEGKTELDPHLDVLLPYSVYRDPRVSPNAKLVFGFLFTYSNTREFKDDEADMLGGQLGCEASAIFQSIEELERLEYLTVEKFRNYRKKVLIKSEPSVEGMTESEKLEEEMRVNKQVDSIIGPQNHEKDFPHETEEIKALLSQQKFDAFEVIVSEICDVLIHQNPDLHVPHMLNHVLYDAKKMKPKQIGDALVKYGVLDFLVDRLDSIWKPNALWQQRKIFQGKYVPEHEVITEMQQYLRDSFAWYCRKTP